MPESIDNPDADQRRADRGGPNRGGDAPARAPEGEHASRPRSAVAARPRPTPQPRVELCPYCGAESINTTRCDRCAGKFDALSKQATQNAMGPWFLRDEARPHRPGCAYETIRAMVTRGSIIPDTVLRGPTTRQFWTRAAQTPGVAHLLGACHSCKRDVDPGAFMCPACGVSFQPETDRQHLGLSSVSLLPGQATPERVAAVSVPTGSLPPPPPSQPIAMPREPIAPIPSRTPLHVAALNAEWGLGPSGLDVIDTPSTTVPSRRSTMSGAGVVVAAFCGVVIGVVGLGGVLVWSRGGLEPALASLGLGEQPPPATVVAERGVPDGAPPSARDPAAASPLATNSPTAQPPAGINEPATQVASNTPAPTLPTPDPVAEPPDPVAPIADVLREGAPGSMREARALIDRYEGDGSLSAADAAAWRAALDQREAVSSLAGLP
ncbi:MAG: hypothetical protein R3B68_01575 [Phycisphaerales bacterium]